jgi:hypothetical protein
MVRCNKIDLSRQMPGVKRFLCGAQSTSGHQPAARDDQAPRCLPEDIPVTCWFSD